MQYFHFKGLSPNNIKVELDCTLGESAPSFTTIKYWVSEFKRRSTSCQEEQCTSSHIRYSDGQNQWVKVQFVSLSTLFARFSPLRLFYLSKLKKMTQWWKICQQWRGRVCAWWRLKVLRTWCIEMGDKVFFEFFLLHPWGQATFEVGF